MLNHFKFPNIHTNLLDPGDFVLITFNFDEFDKMLKEHFNDIDKMFKKFDEELPQNVSYALLPGVQSFIKTNNKEMAKLIIDEAIRNYNNHFNDIYIPYTD